MYEKYFTKTGMVLSLLFKQLRWKLLIWLSSIIGINLIVAAFYPTLYDDEASRLAAAMTMENPAMVAMLGPGYDTEAYIASSGPFFANEMLLFTAIAVAIMTILLVSQSTRGDEEEGRVEIIQALAVGRVTYTNAVMIIIIVTNIILALFLGIGLTLLNIEGMDLTGSLLYGSILGATGLVFGGITAMVAQLFENGRTVTMVSLMILIIAYVLRAIGDVNSELLSLFSPLGWTVRTSVYDNNDWLPVIVLTIVSLLFGLIAFYLHSKRDIGAGFIAPRKGKEHASKFLQTPIGLILWMQKSNIIAWTLALFVLTLSMGYVLGDMETYWKDVEIISEFIEGDLSEEATEQFIALIIAIMSLIGVIPVVITVLRLKVEEIRNFTENIYSRAVSRSYLLGNYLLLAIIVSVIMQLAITVGLWSGGVAVLDEPLSFAQTFKAAFLYLPAIWLFVGLVTFLFGNLPKFTSLIWIYFAYCFFVIYLGNLLDMPQYLRNISVFEHIAQIPLEDVNFLALTIIILLTIIFTILGFIGYRNRDLIG